jgi:hypothetical protein
MSVHERVWRRFAGCRAALGLQRAPRIRGGGPGAHTRRLPLALLEPRVPQREPIPSLRTHVSHPITHPAGRALTTTHTPSPSALRHHTGSPGAHPCVSAPTPSTVRTSAERCPSRESTAPTPAPLCAAGDCTGVLDARAYVVLRRRCCEARSVDVADDAHRRARP